MPARNNLVDVLRGISILLVLILHFHLAYRLDQSALAQVVPPQWIRSLARNGNYGVTIFFVLSGYLITSTSLARFGSLRALRPLKFYEYRFARIAPNIALMVTLVVGLGLAGLKIFQNDAGSVSMPVTVLSIVTFTHNLLMEKFGYFNYCLNILWSLSVEEIFYLAFPLLCLSFRKKTWLAGVLGAFVMIAPFYRARHSENEIVALYAYLSCFDAIAIGCLVALFKPNRTLPIPLSRMFSLFAISVMTVVYFRQGILSNGVVGVSLMALSTGALLWVAPPSGQGALSSSSALGWLRHLGRNSYELYLFHVILLALLKVAITREAMGSGALKLLVFALFLAVSAALAEVLSRYYAEPMRRMIHDQLSGK